MQCSICYNEITECDKTVTSCNHIFHFTCLLKNYKNNTCSGNQCPLCSKPFLKSTIQTSHSNTYIPPHNWVSVLNRVRDRLSRNRPPVRSRNQIIRDINFRRRSGRITSVVPRTRLQEIQEEIDRLTFEQLKERLVAEGLSSRGYVRANLETRLINKLIHQ